MSKFKIEKVDHSNFTSCDTCCITSYYPTSDTLSQNNFIFEENANWAKTTCTTGKWRIKSLKNKTN